MESKSELEETLRRLQHHKGVTGVIVVNSAGMVTKTTLDNTTTAKITSMVSAITVQAKSVVRDLDPVNDLKFLRMRSSRTEILIAPGLQTQTKQKS